MASRFLIDGMLSGTGVRHAINGGYVDPMSIGLSEQLSRKISSWQALYEEAHFVGFPSDLVAELDKEGAAITSRIRDELVGADVGYFSNGLMKQLD